MFGASSLPSLAAGVVLFTIGLHVVRLLLVWQDLLRVRVQAPHHVLADPSQVPPHVVTRLEAPMADLAALGFTHVGWAETTPLIRSSQRVRWMALMHHAG